MFVCVCAAPPARPGDTLESTGRATDAAYPKRVQHYFFINKNRVLVSHATCACVTHSLAQFGATRRRAPPPRPQRPQVRPPGHPRRRAYVRSEASALHARGRASGAVTLHLGSGPGAGHALGALHCRRPIPPWPHSLPGCRRLRRTPPRRPGSSFLGISMPCCLHAAAAATPW